jgi:hypothetical protein
MIWVSNLVSGCKGRTLKVCEEAVRKVFGLRKANVIEEWHNLYTSPTVMEIE